MLLRYCPPSIVRENTNRVRRRNATTTTRARRRNPILPRARLVRTDYACRGDVLDFPSSFRGRAAGGLLLFLACVVEVIYLVR